MYLQSKQILKKAFKTSYLLGSLFLIASPLFINVKIIQKDPVYFQILSDSHYFMFLLFGFLILELVNLNNFSVTEWPDCNYLISIVIGIAISFLFELIQPFFNRAFEFSDVLLNLWGIFSINGLFYFWNKQRSLPVFSVKKISAISFTIIISFFTFYIFYGWGYAFINKMKWQRQFPLFASFEGKWELKRWELNPETDFEISSKYATHGKCSLKVRTGIFRYPGIVLNHPTANWSKKKFFAFSIYNPADEVFTLHIRLDSDSMNQGKGDRTYLTPLIEPGLNEIKFELKEIQLRNSDEPPFNLEHISRVVFFINRPHKPMEFYLDNIRLE